MFCNQCGQKKSDDAKFCNSCSNKIENVELWNPNATANWSLLFTPIFGSYLQMKNWQALGKLEEANTAKYWLIFTIGFIFFINFFSYLVDANTEQASTVARNLGIWYIIIWYFAYARKQPKYVKYKLKDKYQKKSWVIPLISATVILFIVIFIFIVIGLSLEKQINQKSREIDWTNTKYDNDESLNSTQYISNTNNIYDISLHENKTLTDQNSSSIYVANPEINPSQYISRTNNKPQYAIDYSEQDNYDQNTYHHNNQNNNVGYSSNNYNSYENSTNSYSVPAPQHAPSTITNCDNAGCWGSDGTRYNKAAGNTYFPSTGGSCQNIGGQMQCN